MFVYINNNPTSEDYQLILVNNRDEHYIRPTKPATFWNHCSQCIGGLDLTAGRENGTWLGMSKHGKVGSLLNILTPYDPLPSKRGRGHLVTDYLQESVSAQTYLNRISEDGAHFNAFSLVLLEKEEQGDWNLLYYSNSDVSDNKIQRHSDGVHGISNSVFDKPFQKVNYGKQRFEEIIKKCGRPAYREQLLHELTHLMSDRTNFDDIRIKEQSGCRFQQDKIDELSKIFVSLSTYGTKTTTILLVDHQNNCEFIERTMREPVDAKNPTWNTTYHNFSLSHPAAKI